MKSLNRLLCWLTHALTSSGAIIGLWAIYCSTHNLFKISLLLLLLSIFIDSIDGPIARVLNVKKHIKQFDGALLDNIVDFFTWSIVPCYLLLQKPLFSAPINALLTSAILFASCYQFCCLDAKVNNNQYFKRFPSLWSATIVAIYVSVWPHYIIVFILTVSVILSFIPIYVPKAFSNATIHSNPTFNTFCQHINNIENLVFITASTLGVFFYPRNNVWITAILSVAILLRVSLWALTTIHLYSKNSISA